MADNYSGKPIRTVSGAQSCLGEERKYGKKKKKSAYPHPLAATEGCEDVPVRSGRGE